MRELSKEEQEQLLSMMNKFEDVQDLNDATKEGLKHILFVAIHQFIHFLSTYKEEPGEDARIVAKEWIEEFVEENFTPLL